MSVFQRMSRRRALWMGLLLGIPLLLAGIVVDAFYIEPNCLEAHSVTLPIPDRKHRIVHFTDLHYKGDRAQLEKLVALINAQKPSFVCFTGDLVESNQRLPEALAILKGIACPIYGIPGNHDYWAKVDFVQMARAFEATGGRLLMEQSATIADGQINIVGWSKGLGPPLEPVKGMRNLLLIHYPAWADHAGRRKYDLILAGHSHGGQVRLPFIGAPVLPFETRPYDRGLFNTAAGPLYVSSGVGWFTIRARFLCRPEIVVMDL